MDSTALLMVGAAIGVVLTLFHFVAMFRIEAATKRTTEAVAMLVRIEAARAQREGVTVTAMTSGEERLLRGAA